MTPVADESLDSLRAANVRLQTDNTQLRAMVEELRDAVTALRATVAKQDAHIHRLVKLTFGVRSERRDGPTLFDNTPPDEATATPPEEPTPSDTPLSQSRRRGHGRKKKPADLPRQRDEIDFTEAVCDPRR